MPFDLHPEYPPHGVPRKTLDGRYGKGFRDRVAEMIEEAGFTHAPPPVIPRSLPALQLAELARDDDRHDALHPRLFGAYWSEGRDIGDPAVLADVAAEAGLDPAAAEEASSSADLAGRVRRSSEAAQRIGVDAVPAWLIDNQLLVMGAQPHSVFENVMAKLGHTPIEEVDDQLP